ncbi:MAG: hypothetical protein H6658_01005 [Ardenticatenaceae bacterium]|nr:hypothetical protein [Ardenticatenaceae bacterium]
MKRRVGWLMAVWVLAGMGWLSLFGLVQPLHAATWTVGIAPCTTTIQACINLAAPGDTVNIPTGVYMESLSLNKAVSLVGAGTSSTFIRAAAGQRVLTISGAAVDSSVQIVAMRLQNGDVAGGNQCSAGFVTTNCGGGILITGNAAPTLSNLIIRNNAAYSGGGLFVDAGSFLPPLDNVTLLLNDAVLAAGGAYFVEGVTVNNGRFESNEALNNVAGGARFSGDTVINNSVFLDNTANCTSSMGICHAGGLYAFEVNLTINNSTFANNRCVNPFDNDCDGGGVYWSRSFNGPYTVSVNDTDFINNEATRSGGGLMLASSFFADEVLVTGGRFEGNVAATGDGGAIRAARLVLSGTQIVANTAGGFKDAFSEGGAVNTAYTTTITNAVFSGNVSQDRGGALVVDSVGPVTIDNSVFFSNTARDNGGAIYISLAETRLLHSRIEANRVTTTTTFFGYGYGGGLWAGNDLFLTDTEVISNVTRWRGGGVYAAPGGGGQVGVVNGRFAGNSTLARIFIGDGGGGLYVLNSSGPTTISGTAFLSNTAVGGGGGMFAFGPVSLLGGRIEGNESTEQSGGGLFVDGSFTASGGSQFVHNRADFSGGGLAVDGTAMLTGAVFTDNEVVNGSGGGAYVADELTINSSQFVNNQTTGFTGGGLAGFGAMTVTNSLFQDNVSAGSGGGLAGSFGVMTLAGNQFLGNTAVNNGGGLSTSGNIVMTNNLIQQNQTTVGSGGGLYTSGSVVATDNTIHQNIGALHGGGAFINSGATFIGGILSDNQAAAGSGGGYYGTLSQLRVNGTTFTQNQAAVNGGGAYAFDGMAVGNGLFTENTAGNAGGGLFLHRFANITATQFLSNTADLGGGLAISRTSTGTAVQSMVNSVFANNTAGTSGTDFYYNQPRPINLIHNTFAQAGLGGGSAVYVAVGTVALINNIVTSHTTGIENVAGTVSSDFNLFFGNNNNTVGTVASSNSVVGDPDFVNAANHDFRLVIGSPALDSGTNAGVTVDLLGMARPLNAGFDRGAYEGQFTPTAVTLTTLTVQPSSPIWRGLFLILLLISISYWRRKT